MFDLKSDYPMATSDYAGQAPRRQNRPGVAVSSRPEGAQERGRIAPLERELEKGANVASQGTLSEPLDSETPETGMWRGRGVQAD